MKHSLLLSLFLVLALGCKQSSERPTSLQQTEQNNAPEQDTYNIAEDSTAFIKAIDDILSMKKPLEARTDSALRFIRANSNTPLSHRISESILGDRLISMAEERGLSDELLARLYDEHAQMLVRQGASNHDKWVRSFDKALEYANKTGNRYLSGLILDHKGLGEIHFGDPASGFQLEEEAIKAYNGSGGDSDRRISRCYYNQAVVMLQNDDMDGMERVIDRLKEHAASVSGQDREFALYNQYTVQTAYFSTLLENGATIERNAIIDSIDAIGIASIHLLENADLRGTNVNPTWDYYNRAVRFVNYDDLPRVDSVEYYLQKMTEGRNIQGKWTDIEEAMLSATSLRAEMWMKLGNYRRAEQAFKTAIEKIDTLKGVNNVIIDKIQLYKGLIEIAKQTGNYEEATAYAETLNDLEKERFSDERAKAVKEIEIKYKTQEAQLLLARSEARRSTTLMWLSVAAALLIIIAATFIIYVFRQRRRRIQQEMEFNTLRADIDRRLTRQYVEGLETERERMSRELHDGVCNDLLAIQMNMHEGLDITSTERLIESCRDSVRRISHELMPPEFTYANIDEVVRYHVGKQKEAGMQITYDSETEGTDWDSVPDHIALEIYRIIQEAIGNASKHSGGDSINVKMSLSGNVLTASVTDNGHYAMTGKRGIGLNSMRRRANAIDAKLDIEMQEGEGTNIALIVRI